MSPQPVTHTVASWVATQRVAVSLFLIVALVALAIPYGASTPGVEGHLTVFEWVVSGLALVAAVGLTIDLARPLRQRERASGLAFLLSAAVWSAAGAYQLFHGPQIGWGFATSQGLLSAGVAALSLYEWRRVTLEPRLVITDE